MEKNKDKEDQSIMDKSMRSVFVGNIPYEATEEKLKDIFSEVGPVLSFKLVFDRETGKPKGYGFCEYKDQETALSAMRNLNGYEIGGRSLRVDNACTEKSRMEMQALMQGPQIENPYGEPCDPEKAPEAISRAVASLPPEQMFELMKQMKLCIQNNPQEARNMLLQNPQLAYALLQAQVVMRIVDPSTALSMVHPTTPVPPILHPDKMPVPQPAFQGLQNQAQHNMQNQHNIMPNQHNVMSNQHNMMQNPAPPIPQMQPTMIPAPIAAVPPPMPQQQPYTGIPSSGDVDLRGSRVMDQDMRMVPNDIGISIYDNPTMNPSPAPTRSDPRARVDPRSKQTQAVPPPQQNRPAPIIPTGTSDQEKAALIMQVLQLSDEQIAKLPPEQRASILVLKEQIAKSAHPR